MSTPLKETQLQCLNCKTWFRSPIQVANERGFDNLNMQDCTFGCPACRLKVPFGKANMRWQRADERGGYSGDDTVGPNPPAQPFPKE
jgi:hypothetical protein